MVILSLILVLLVAGSCAAVTVLFFRRLRHIEAELWGQKAREAADTAAAEQQQHAPQENSPA